MRLRPTRLPEIPKAARVARSSAATGQEGTVPIATTITAAPPAVLEQGEQLAAIAPVAAAPPQGIAGRAVLGGVVVILLGWGASILLNRAADPQALKIPAGISVFALFYVVTQGIERLLEPFARLWDGTREPAG